MTEVTTRPQNVPHRPRAILQCDLGDELLVYVSDRNQALTLNASARAIWERCDGRCTIQQITQALALATGLSSDELLPQVQSAILRMGETGVLEVDRSGDE